MMKIKLSLLSLFLTITIALHAQSSKDEIKEWHLKDYTEATRGTNVEKAYAELLANKSPKEEIIVAVIDSGIDIQHEDLADVIWTNDDEIAGNGIDDDNNGYIDDVNGWNYLGNANGDMVNKDNLEVARLYKILSEKWENKDVNVTNLSKEDLIKWKYYQRVKNEFEEGKLKAENMKKQFNAFYTAYSNSKSVLAEELGEEFTAEELEKFDTENENQTKAKEFMQRMFENGVDEEYVNSYKDYVSSQADWYYNENVDVRADIIKDDPNNLYEIGYGNNKLIGEDPSHGTHVAGIIGAVRNNDIGINGIANNIKIMVLRTVPGGDEHDKDVANSIRYAVDNGARVVNMSFGKAFSPYEKIVAEAIQYAEDNDVILVHAAGNSSLDLDVEENYPTNYSDCIKGKVKTYLTIGASSLNANKDFPASFSNYGGDKVDIFAPGVDIYSTYPDNEYAFNSGTSMAAPVVSGIAALILSYYPDLKGKEVVKILTQSATDLSTALVYLPGSGGMDDEGNEIPKEEIRFSELSKVPGLVNAYTALQLADKKSKY